MNRNHKLTVASQAVGPAGVVGVYIARWLVLNALGTDHWLVLHTPWLVGVCLAFSAGQVAAALSYDKSQLRRWLDQKRSVFVLDRIIPRRIVVAQLEVIKLTAMLTTVRDCRLAIRVVVHQFAGEGGRDLGSFLLTTEDVVLSKGERHEIILAVLPIKSYDGQPEGYPCWGDEVRRSGDVSGMRSLVGGTENLVAIIGDSDWWFRSKAKAFVATTNETSGHLFVATTNRSEVFKL